LRFALLLLVLSLVINILEAKMEDKYTKAEEIKYEAGYIDIANSTS